LKTRRKSDQRNVMRKKPGEQGLWGIKRRGSTKQTQKEEEKEKDTGYPLGTLARPKGRAKKSKERKTEPTQSPGPGRKKVTGVKGGEPESKRKSQNSGEKAGPLQTILSGSHRNKKGCLLGTIEPKKCNRGQKKSKHA